MKSNTGVTLEDSITRNKIHLSNKLNKSNPAYLKSKCKSGFTFESKVHPGELFYEYLHEHFMNTFMNTFLLLMNTMNTLRVNNYFIIKKIDKYVSICIKSIHCVHNKIESVHDSVHILFIFVFIFGGLTF